MNEQVRVMHSITHLPLCNCDSSHLVNIGIVFDSADVETDFALTFKSARSAGDHCS
jgi:hypothetical protein